MAEENFVYFVNKNVTPAKRRGEERIAERVNSYNRI